MRIIKNILIFSLIVSCISCDGEVQQEINIVLDDVLLEQNDVECIFCFDYYTCFSKEIIFFSDSLGQKLTFLFPKKEWYRLVWFQLGITNVEKIQIKEVIINNISLIEGNNIVRTITWKQNATISQVVNNEKNIVKICRLDDERFYFAFSPPLFYRSLPSGLQLFIRISLLAVFLIFIFILIRQASTQYFLILTIALFLVSFPLKMNYTNYTMGIMILTMLIAFIYNKSSYFKWQPIFYVLCAIYLMNLIGLMYTEDFNIGIKRLDTTIILFFFPLVFSMIQFPKKNLVLLLRFFVWVVIAFCTFGLLSYITIVPEFTWDMAFRDSKIYAPLLMMWPAHPHPSYLSVILLMAPPVALYLRYQDEKQVTMAEMLLSTLLPIVFTFLSGARIGMVIAPVLLGLGYLFYCKFNPMLKWSLVVAGMVALGVVFHFFPNIDDRFGDVKREDLRKTAISAIKEKPIFGWGTGSAKLLIHSEERAHSLEIETPYDFNQFHNQYLEDMAQFGIPGIFILLVLFGWILWIGIREKNYLLLSLFVIYAFFCWTETVLFVAKGVIPFTFWFCFLISNKIENGKTCKIVRCVR